MVVTETKKAVTARVPNALKQAFSARAFARGLSESELLRELIATEVGKADRQIPLAEVDLNNLTTGRMTVRLPGFLLDGAKARAQARNMAPSRWVAALVQSNLTALPVLTHQEVNAVVAANRELAAIGRNINQIARALNENYRDVELARVDRLQQLLAVLVSDRAAIHALIQASRQGWGAVES